MTNLSKKLCEICGIKPLYRVEDLEILQTETALHLIQLARKNSGYEDIKAEPVYPDFEQPENFVKLLELKILTGATLWGWLSIQGVFMSQRKTVLKTIYLILSGEINFCNKLTLEQIKQAIRETEWVYE